MKTNDATLNPGSGLEEGLSDLGLRDIQGPLDIPYEWAWVAWLLSALAILGILVWLWYWWQRRPQTVRPQAASIPAHRKAREKLREAEQYLHDPEPFVVLVSDALRVYLEERFSMQAPERTTEEFLMELPRSVHLNAEQKQTVGEFLQWCDLVKFARYQPAEEDLRNLLAVAHRLIDETEPSAMALVSGEETNGDKGEGVQA